VKKPSVFCEALFKLLGKSAFFADFHQQRQFPQASFLSFLLLFSFFTPLLSFPPKNFAPGSPRNDDRQLARPRASPVLSLLKRLQRDACFHFSAEAPPLPRFHLCSVSEAGILLINSWSEL
jgi:hypothetical protein